MSFERQADTVAGIWSCVKAGVQNDWLNLPPTPPAAIVSMSAIQNLDPAEKQTFYPQSCTVLASAGRSKVAAK